MLPFPGLQLKGEVCLWSHVTSLFASISWQTLSQRMQPQRRLTRKKQQYVKYNLKFNLTLCCCYAPVVSTKRHLQCVVSAHTPSQEVFCSYPSSPKDWNLNSPNLPYRKSMNSVERSNSYIKLDSSNRSHTSFSLWWYTWLFLSW